MKKLGLVGFGKFGKAFYEHCIKAPVLVYDKDAASMQEVIKERENFPNLGAAPATLEQISVCDVIFIAVPISELKGLYCYLGPRVKKSSLIVDCSSVQTNPQKFAQEVFTKCSYISMHCLFGPESLSRGVKPLRAVLSGIRSGKTAGWLVDFLAASEVTAVVRSPAEHDNAMGKSMVICHTLAQALARIGVLEVEEAFHTGSFSLLRKMVGMLKEDTPEPYNTIVKGNPYARSVLDSLIKELTVLYEEIL